MTLRKNKYNAKKVVIDGITFDSQMESRRYLQLKLLEKARIVHGLEIHPKIKLMVNGVYIGDYVGDFSYLDSETGEDVLEDVKTPATATPVYKLKRKILETLGIYITEVTA